MRHRVTLRLAVAALTAAVTGAAPGRTIEVEPGEDYRPMLRALEPGDELVFLPGVHKQHARFSLTGTAQAPITLRGKADPDGRRPEIRWTERGHNTWRISGEHIRIRGLAFHSAQHYGMRVGQGAHITIRDCLFRDNGGGDLSANSGRIVSLHVLDSRFVGGRRTPVYIGSHDGDLTVRDFRFEGNVVDGSRIDHDGVVGYGIQLKLNVDGVIRNNFIRGTQGPAIMVYGFDAPDTEHQQIVENNITGGARNSANIVVGGGPATLRNNLALGGHSGGIAVIDYGNRDLLDGIELSGNIAAGNEGHGMSIHPDARDPTATGNAAYTAPDGRGFRGLPASGPMSDNQATTAKRDLLEVVRKVRQRLPGNAAVREATEMLKADRPESQRALVRLLRCLLEQ